MDTRTEPLLASVNLAGMDRERRAAALDVLVDMQDCRGSKIDPETGHHWSNVIGCLPEAVELAVVAVIVKHINATARAASE
ncbi:MAG: hypothetical protein WCK05_10240 [Planctomycetota bacterium]